MLYIILILIIIGLGILLYKNKKRDSYFLSIHFSWNEIFKLLDINEGMEFDEEPINTFEYLIKPNKSLPIIFDQQTNKFFTSGNTYNNIFYGKNKSSISCYFGISNERIKGDIKNFGDFEGQVSGFLIEYKSSKENKYVAIIFDSKFLNLNYSPIAGSLDFNVYTIKEEYNNSKAIKVINKINLNQYIKHNKPLSLTFYVSTTNYSNSGFSLLLGLLFNDYFKEAKK